MFLCGCAAIGPPDGGPKDTTPPQLLDVSPARGTLNFTGGEIHLVFSEYIDERTVEKSIRVSPRLDVPLPFKYKGKEIFFYFPKDLAEDQTYVITLSRDMKDEQGVSLDRPIQIAYSTGEVIDQGSLSGRVIGSEKYVLHLWESVEDDSIFARSPLYVSDARDDGRFSFQYLSPGDYTLLALEKAGAGLALMTERMAYGVPSQRNYHLSRDQNLGEINIQTWREPQSLRMIRGEWLGRNWGWIYFNNVLESETEIGLLKLKPEEEIEVIPEYFHDPGDRSRMLIVSSDTLPSGKMAIRIETISIDDSVLLDSASIAVRIPAEADTNFLELIQPEVLSKFRPDDLSGPTLSLVFSRPVIDVGVNAFTLIKGDSDTVAVKLQWQNPLWADLLPDSGWMQKSSYQLQLSAQKIIPLEGRSFKDSVLTIKIQIGKNIGYGGLAGTVQKITRTPLVTTITSLKKSPKTFTAVVNSALQFQYNHIPEGLYQLMLFEDRNQDGIYSFGKAYPFQPSEWFYLDPDTIEVRANWDIELRPVELREEKL